MSPIARTSNLTASSYDFLYLEINVFCAVMLLYMVFEGRMYRIRHHKEFANTFFAASACFVFDALWTMMLDGTIPTVPVLFLILKDLYFLSTTLMGFSWYLYTERALLDRYRGREVLLACPLLFVELFLLVWNWFDPILFSFENGVYIRGPLFVPQYLISYIYVILASVDSVRFSLRREHFEDRHTGVLHALFPIAPGAAGILQYFFPAIPVLCCAVTFFVSIVYHYAAADLISMDPLTQLANRRRFLEKLREKTSSPPARGGIYLFMMDVDYFKQINDSCGHPEGDRALTAVADALRSAAEPILPRPVLGRYGGDEFCILAELAGENAREDLEHRIDEAIAYENRKENRQYSLSLSIGWARWKPGMLPIEFLKQADESLYEVKKQHHTMRL